MTELINYPVPSWVSVLFLLAILVPVIMVCNLVWSTLTGNTNYNAARRTTLFFVLYISYVLCMGYFGQFGQVLFPPKVILFTTFPLLLFVFCYLIRTHFFNDFIQKVSLSSLVRIHIFRLVGSFFIILAMYEALPFRFGIIAGLGDILVALTSLFISRYISKGHVKHKKITFAWNTFGLIDIVFTAVSANVLTKLSIDHGIMGVDTLAMFPFFLIPALAPPIIITLHYAIYTKLKHQ